MDAIAVGVHRMQRNFEPMCKQVERWRQTERSNITADFAGMDVDRNDCDNDGRPDSFINALSL